MPYYKWNGIDLEGKNFYGKRFACSEKVLQDYLLKEQIGLVRAAPIPGSLWTRSISQTQKAAFFKQFSKLLRSGLLVPQALAILSKHGYGNLSAVAREVHANVERGGSLFKSAQAFPEVFDLLTLQLIRVGQQTSGLSDSLDKLSVYMEERIRFYKKLRSQLIMPFITLMFFLLVVNVIFVALVPAFERVFTLMQKEPPAYTQWLFYASTFFTNSTALWIMGTVIGSYFITKYLFKPRWKQVRSKILLMIPGSSRLISNYAYSYYFHAMGALCGSGMQVLEATQFAVQTIDNEIIAERLSKVGSFIEMGDSFQEALKLAMGPSFDYQAQAIIEVGEQTNSLGPMCSELSEIYFEKNQKLLSLLLVILQPTVMIFLGGIIALLIVSVYVPLLSIPDVVGG